ncbi:MAG: hypothetical protein M5R36_09115 [Deltaproteobacteria bacterium]|nr:hypothetical protein [Deltaproteobacteria bacterium]
MRRFLEDKEVRTVYQQAFTFDGRPYMAVLVKYLETGRQPAAGDGKESARPENGKSAPGNAPASKDAKPDPREGLSDRQVAEYEALRRWRFDLAQKKRGPRLSDLPE